MIVSGLLAQPAPQETQVRQAVQSFYEAFNTHNFGRVPEFTTADWTHIHPFGGWTRGRDAVLKELKEVHSTFLKGVTDTPGGLKLQAEGHDVRYRNAWIKELDRKEANTDF